MIWTAACASWLAVFCAWELPEGRLFRRLRPVEHGVQRSPTRRATWATWLAITVAIIAVGQVVAGRVGVVVGVVSVECLAVLAILARRAKHRRRRRAAQTEVVRAAETLAARLRVGGIPSVALAAAASEHQVLAESAAALAVGGDAAAELAAAASRPGHEGLADVAAAWQVAASTGASLCDSLDAAAVGLARQQEVQATVNVELAATRAATRMLAVLPSVGIALGYGFGGNPLEFLLRNIIGELCLMLAVALTGAGLVWSDVLADKAGG